MPFISASAQLSEIVPSNALMPFSLTEHSLSECLYAFVVFVVFVVFKSCWLSIGAVDSHIVELAVIGLKTFLV